MAVDLFDPSFPYGTADGYTQGCRGSACPYTSDPEWMSCKQAFLARQGNYHTQREYTSDARIPRTPEPAPATGTPRPALPSTTPADTTTPAPTFDGAAAEPPTVPDPAPHGGPVEDHDSIAQAEVLTILGLSPTGSSKLAGWVASGQLHRTGTRRFYRYSRTEVEQLALARPRGPQRSPRTSIGQSSPPAVTQKASSRPIASLVEPPAEIVSTSETREPLSAHAGGGIATGLTLHIQVPDTTAAAELIRHLTHQGIPLSPVTITVER